MAEERQTLDERLEAEMAKIASLEISRRAYDDAQKESERAEARDHAWQVFDSELDRADEERYHQQRDMLANELAKDTYRKIRDGLTRKIRGISEDYSSNAGLILGRIEDKLNAELAKINTTENFAKDKTVMALLPYFIQAVYIPFNQKQADRQLLEDFRRRTGITTTEYHHGVADVERERIFAYRRLIADLIVEEKDREGKVTGYRIDSEKLKEYVDNPIVGSILYHAEKPREREEA